MDIDLDWCLSCEKRFDGQGPYCSPDCQPAHYEQSESDWSEEFDDDIIYHPIDGPSYSARWFGNGDSGIHAWAAEVPAGPPISSEHVHRPQLPSLLQPSRRAIPPSLCVSTPTANQPTPSALPTSVTPVPQRQSSLASLASLKSFPTESSIATPASSSQPLPISTSRKASIIGDVYNHVRSWVSASPAIYVPPPVHRVSSAAIFPEPTTAKPHPPSRERSRLVSELALLYDEHPSFRARGRKASRAAA